MTPILGHTKLVKSSSILEHPDLDQSTAIQEPLNPYFAQERFLWMLDGRCWLVEMLD
jgi:hypothetical protein